MFLETICIQNGIVKNRESHRARMQHTATHFGFRAPVFPDLIKLIPPKLNPNKIKCRIVYHHDIIKISFTEYMPRKIRSLQLIEASELNYSYKFSDRSALDSLLLQKGRYDEILIVRHGCITDTSYSNVVFKKGDALFTPDTYILNGTKRQQLLREGAIHEMRITTQNIYNFEAISLINSMLDIKDEMWIREINGNV